MFLGNKDYGLLMFYLIMMVILIFCKFKVKIILMILNGMCLSGWIFLDLMLYG